MKHGAAMTWPKAPRAPNAARRLGGRAAQSNGANAEDALEHVHAGYRRAGHYVQRQGPRVKWIGRGGAARPVAIDDGPPDLLVVAAGRPYLAEVKSESSDRWALAHLPAHQADALDWAQGAGTVCGVVLWLAPAAAWWWLPWAELGPRWRRWDLARRQDRAAPGTASLDVVDLDLVGRRCPGGDWLPVAESFVGCLDGAR